MIGGPERTCVAKDRGLDLDDWCQVNCNLADPSCPIHMCECDKPIECVSALFDADRNKISLLASVLLAASTRWPHVSRAAGSPHLGKS